MKFLSLPFFTFLLLLGCADSEFETLKKEAEAGEVLAQYNLAVSYDQGKGVDQDYKKAVKWYTSAADQGDLYAQSNLGVMYEEGHGVEQDYQEALKWYTMSAQRGHAIAQRNLGSMHLEGRGTKKDLIKAFAWYEIASVNGDDQALEWKASIRFSKEDLEKAKVEVSRIREVIKASKEPEPSTE